MKTLQNRAQIVFSNESGFGTTLLASPDCTASLFADPEVSRIVDSVVSKSSGLVRCAVGQSGETFAFSVRTADYSICAKAESIQRGLVAGGRIYRGGVL